MGYVGKIHFLVATLNYVYAGTGNIYETFANPKDTGLLVRLSNFFLNLHISFVRILPDADSNTSDYISKMCSQIALLNWFK